MITLRQIKIWPLKLFFFWRHMYTWVQFPFWTRSMHMRFQLHLSYYFQKHRGYPLSSNKLKSWFSLWFGDQSVAYVQEKVYVEVLSLQKEMTIWSVSLSAGADGLFVHMMAVNERARSFYDKLGFRVEKEESSNEAHYRGRCLDGVEGRARSILMRDSRL